MKPFAEKISLYSINEAKGGNQNEEGFNDPVSLGNAVQHFGFSYDNVCRAWFKGNKQTSISSERAIFHGINNGSLTRREARRLGAEQAKIRVDKFYAKHNDGHIGPREFIYLNHELNHSSQHIYCLKHNDRTRWQQLA